MFIEIRELSTESFRIQSAGEATQLMPATDIVEIVRCATGDLYIGLHCPRESYGERYKSIRISAEMAGSVIDVMQRLVYKRAPNGDR